MKELSGKVAVISGGAEGIGLALARVLGQLGMSVVIADINAGQLGLAESELEALGIPLLAVELDVADASQWQSLVEKTLARFGKIHLLVNNAGVGGAPRPVGTGSEQDWRWIIDVNLMGVVHGTEAVVPVMRSQGEGGWIINVASMAGFIPLPMASAYSATKAAVVSLSECWRAELEPSDIRVSVLCPGFVKTRINLSQRNRQEHYESSTTEAVAGALSPDIEQAMSAQMQAVIDAGASAELIAHRVVEALSNNEFYIVTHPNFLPAVAGRFQAITGAFERAASSELLRDILEEDIPGFDE